MDDTKHNTDGSDTRNGSIQGAALGIHNGYAVKENREICNSNLIKKKKEINSSGLQSSTNGIMEMQIEILMKRMKATNLTARQ